MFHTDIYQLHIILFESRVKACADDATKAKCELQQAKKNMHPGFAIVFDNIDGKRECWHMPKDNQNFDFYWVNHKIIMNRVPGGCLETLPRDITSLSNL